MDINNWRFFAWLNLYSLFIAKLRQNIQEQLPFISVLHYGDDEYVGIIINQDQFVTTFFDLNMLHSPEEKTNLLEIGEIWWWESNRLIPINLFLKSDWLLFKGFLRTFSSKSLVILHGPVCSMQDLNKRRIKRRSITLVKKM